MSDNITANRIVYLRELRGLLQPDLARIAQIEQSYVSKLEHGKAPNVSGVVLVRIARALETTTDYLLGISDNPNTLITPNHPILHDPYFSELAPRFLALDDERKRAVVHFVDLIRSQPERRAAQRDDEGDESVASP